MTRWDRHGRHLSSKHGRSFDGDGIPVVDGSAGLCDPPSRGKEPLQQL